MSAPITSKNYADELMTLVDETTLQSINEGDVRATSRGDLYRVTGGRAPHNENSSGKIWCRDPLAKIGDTSSSEFYPSVIGAKWATPNDVGYAIFRRDMNSVAEKSYKDEPYSDEQTRACWDTMHQAERDEWIARVPS